MNQPCFVGIDVGTGSARAGIFDLSGRTLATAVQPIKLFRPAPDFVEQSSDDIWGACCRATRSALRQAGLGAASVKGVGFAATCSLVVLDRADRPVAVGPTGRPAQNVIVWMDHRAVAQAERINATRHPVLRYVGGTISPEMQTPKLLWLKENRPAAWRRAGRFLDLADFLTYRATGDDTRSLCTTVCKWTYLGHRGIDGQGWSGDYFRTIGLGDLAAEQFARLGRRVRPIGEPVGGGLTAAAARELGLAAGTAVGVSLIDAHAGGVGMLGATPKGARAGSFNRRLALIGGTSSCHMGVSAGPRFIKGIWGPYYSAMIPGYYLTEGGQSATGALIDHVIFSHAASGPLARRAAREGRTVHALLNERLEVLAKAAGAKFPAQLTAHLHVQPDFHGNRSPRANPLLKGAISGLTLASGPDELALQYLAAIQAVAYGTRHIIEAMNAKGYAISLLYACGGGTKNPVFLREHADITGCDIVLGREPEAVLLGAAVLGVVASGHTGSVTEAMRRMNHAGSVIRPTRGAVARFHGRKYRVFHQMHADFVRLQRLMQGDLS